MTTDKVASDSSDPGADQIVRPVEEEVVAQVESRKKIEIKERSRKVSGLSLSSIRAKHEYREKKKKSVPEETDLPVESFTESQLRELWEAYAGELEKSGRKILASSLRMDQPRLSGENLLTIELPNHTMRKEVEQEKDGLMRFLRSGLKNYSIDLEIIVNEENARKYAHTPAEKYQKLLEKNPDLDLLRKTFDLDI